MNFQSRAVPSVRARVLYAVFSVAAVLYLPYLVPQQPVASDSYLFGYNNRVGVVLLLVFSVFGALWMRGCGLQLQASGDLRAIPRRVLGWCVGLTFTLCVAMSFFAGRFGGFVESSYEIDRAWFLSQGKRPYIDFEWPFGIYSLYGPVWISRILHIGIPQSYCIFWTVTTVAGVCLLYAVVNLVDYPSLHRTSIFLLVFAAALPAIVGMGTHYTLVRYATPLLFILTLYKMSAGNASRGSQVRVALLAVGFTGCLLLISPEMAVAHAFAAVVILFPMRSPASPGAMQPLTFVAMVAGLVLLFGLAGKLHLLDTMLASGGGADSLPIPFAFPVLFFFGVVFLCMCAVARRAAQPEIHDNSVALIVISVPMLAAALGRCDPGHIFLNGLGLYLAASLYVSSASAAAWRVYRGLFAGCVIALPTISAVLFFGPSLGMAAMRTVAEDSLPGHSRGVLSKLVIAAVEHMPASALKTKEVDRLQKIQLLVSPEVIDFSAVYPGIAIPPSDRVFEAPLGYKPNSIGSYLSSSVDYGFYEAFENANTPKAVQRKVSELTAHPDRSILLREHDADSCTVDPSAERHLMTKLFLFPYMARPTHLTSPHQPLCDYIKEHYTLAQPATLEDYRYELWIPNSR